jgi:diguanylate cyclase (GGDEF)-like protein
VVTRGDSKTRRIYETLRARIINRELPSGAKLPSHLDLATEFAVAPMTVRTVLGQLEAEGLISREQGRGTFVRPVGTPSVLIVDPDGMTRVLLRAHISKVGYRVQEAEDAGAAYDLLERDRSIGLVLADLQAAGRTTMVDFVQTVNRRWPNLPIAAVTSDADALGELVNKDHPLLVLAKPISTYQVDALLRLVLERGAIQQDQRDTLTGLPSRALFQDRLKQTLAYAHRHDQHVAIILLDLDGFAEINESFGHDVGDLLLREVANQLSEHTRDSDTVAHLGGDEFALILPSIHSRENASIVARKIVEKFDSGFAVADRPVRVSTSMGISLYPFDGSDAGALFKAAERALERAKRRRSA